MVAALLVAAPMAAATAGGLASMIRTRRGTQGQAPAAAVVSELMQVKNMREQMKFFMEKKNEEF